MINAGVSQAFQSRQHNHHLKISRLLPCRQILHIPHSHEESVVGSSTHAEFQDGLGSGLYKKFADHAYRMLMQTEWFEVAPISQNLAFNCAPAKGMPDWVVRISTRALVPFEDHPTAKDLVRYARITLLETVQTTSNQEDGTLSTSIHSPGIQVLNFVFLPNEYTSLPVLGIDLVSLPGSKHLLLMDAQPMTDPNNCAWDNNHWKAWYDRYVSKNGSKFPWGGDFPEEVKKFVSPHSLWTRLQEVDDPISVIQEDVWQAFKEHLDLYLELLATYEEDPLSQVAGENAQPAYLDYRRANDPAKPMLNALYGKEWTNNLLDQVLFPKE
ncbi:ferredoxin-dependent bilin reductase [Nitzschia inconspicua]|uniref:Ferredoxin-dependent bilin reductase n=1 Tax=Nitzschia inconspicua TaxID=303405 RepID=A0A9K3PSE3_9STRA|nr:ferredoxin-dependent bilin reductase [Nitzschia inconspicua]